MKGDFSRFTFDRRKHYAGVRLQQGRVQLDADWNEQLDIASYLRQTLIRDLVGASGAPKEGGGFDIIIDRPGKMLLISPGRYYVDGLLCENDAPAPLPITQQADLDPAVVRRAGDADGPFSWYAADAAEAGWYMAYLDAWERSVTALDDPDLLEVALGGPDTSTRVRTVWQVKLIRLGPETANVTCASFPPASLETPPPTLAARALRPPDENQLYRVEVHTGGPAGTATFKWSRDNGAVAALIEKPGQDPSNPFNLVISRQIGPDQGGGFAADQWIEVTDERRLLNGQPGVLAQIGSVSGQELTITGWPPSGPPETAERPLVRRWDGGGTGGDQVIPADGSFIPLEGGLEVSFGFSPDTVFRSGDYWTIPVRAGAGVLWPLDGAGAPVARPAQGIVHHYAPLMLLRQRTQSASGTDDGWTYSSTAPCRQTFEPTTLGVGQEKLNRKANDTMEASLTITGSLSVTNDVTIGPPFTTARLRLDGVPLQPALGDSEQAGIQFTGLSLRGGSTAASSIRFFGTRVSPSSDQYTSPRMVLGVRGLDSAIALQQEGTDVLTVNGGNVGIGVAKGLQKLHVEGGALFRPGTPAGGVVVESSLTLRDGSQGSGRFLVSDLNGKATWKETPLNVGAPVFLGQRLFVANGHGPIGWQTYALAADKVPAGSRAVILDSHAAKSGPDGGDIDGWMLIRRGPDDPGNILMRARAAGGGDAIAWGNQGMFPLKDNTFQYVVTGSGFDGGWELWVIGYFP